jgi:D-alanine-D-alanine ligase
MTAVFTPKIRVAVLRGGPSHDYADSLLTGAHVLSVLQDHHRFEPVDIFISKDGEWHKSGIVYEPHRALQHVDVVLNALHGQYGEDGQVQRLLESLHIPFTGSTAVPSALAMNKEWAKKAYESNSLHTPKHIVITDDNFSDDLLVEIFRTYVHPVVVKPTNGSGKREVYKAHTWGELKAAVLHTLKLVPKVLVEEFIRGREVSCGVIQNARGEKTYTLLPIGPFNTKEKKDVEKAARVAHEILHLRHYSESDFVITKGGKIYILETNSHPKFHKDSHFYKSLEETGWKQEHFIEHIVDLAMRR